MGVVVVTFVLMRALPGDPAAYFAGNAASKEAIEEVRVKLGLDKSLPEQFVVYVRDLARGDLGQSVTTGQPVRKELLSRLPASLELTLTALLLAVLVALPAGVLAATRPGSVLDQAIRVLTTAGVSLPTFFTGLLLVYVFYYLLGWAPSPTGRLDSLFPTPPSVTGFYLADAFIARDLPIFRACLRQLTLPAVTMALFVMAPLARMTRASMLGVLGSDFSKRFPVAIPGEGRRAGHELHAVDDVSFSIARGECVGLVGESSCGKSTLVKLITRLLDATDGRIWFDGHDIGMVPAERFARAPARAQIQMVFQDPTDSLNPRFTAFHTIADPLRRLGAHSAPDAIAARVHELADLVGLPRELLRRYPHQLSGGQKQRVGIARAVALEPALLVLDEPTSALDVSVQAVILKLLEDLRRRLGMSYLFVSHDLNVVRLLADRVLVMYLGRLVEVGPVDGVFARPRHPYTQALLSSMPAPPPDGAARATSATSRSSRIRLSGEPRSPIDPDPNVCRFYGRCPEGFARCGQQMPVLRRVERSAEDAQTGSPDAWSDAASERGDHLVACHLA